MKNQALGVALVLGAAMLWGTTGTAQTFVGEQLSSQWFGALRLAVAALFFAAFAAITQRGAVPRQSALPCKELIGAGICMAVYNLAFFSGVRATGVAMGTAVALGSGPLWAGMLQAAITRRPPARVWWLGTAVAVSGGVLMSLSGAASSNGLNVLGVGFCLLSGLSYAVYSLLTQRVLTCANEPLPAATVTLWAFGIAAALALAFAFAQSGPPVVRSADWVSVCYVGVVTAGIAYLLYANALKHIHAATGVTLALGEPVTAFALAVLVVGERPGWMALAGLVLVVGGVCVVVRSELKPKRS